MSKVLAGEARAVQFPKKTLWPFLTEDDSSAAGLPLHGWQVCASPRPGGGAEICRRVPSSTPAMASASPSLHTTGFLSRLQEGLV